MSVDDANPLMLSVSVCTEAHRFVQARKLESSEFMFTDPPLLIERIARRIDETRISDGMSRIPLDSPGVRSLGELMDYPGLIRELRSVGAPEEALTASTPERSVHLVRQRLPYLRKIRNTGSFWRLMRIVNDLYDYTTPEILESDVESLDARVAAASIEPQWANQILNERCRIDRISCDLGNRSNGVNPATAEDKLGIQVNYYWNATGLLSVEHPSKNADRHVTRPAYTSILEATIGTRPGSLAALNRGVWDYLDRTISGQVRYLNARNSTKIRLEPADSATIDKLLARESGGVPLTDDETDQVASAVGSAIFAWAHEHRRTILMQGLGRSPHQPYGCPATIGRLAKSFRGAKLVLADYARDFARHVHHLAASHPNIALAGFSDSTFATSLIASESIERLQVVPIGKTIGFASLAPNVEWLYANFQAVRYGLAQGLVQAVEIDHLHENRIQDLLAETLEKSAIEFLGL